MRGRAIVASFVLTLAGVASAQTRVATPRFYVDGWVRPAGADPHPMMTNMILVDCYGYGPQIHGHRDPVEAARAAATEIVARLEPPDLTPRDLDRDHVCILLLSFGRDAQDCDNVPPGNGWFDSPYRFFQEADRIPGVDDTQGPPNSFPRPPENYHTFRRF